MFLSSLSLYPDYVMIVSAGDKRKIKTDDSFILMIFSHLLPVPEGSWFRFMTNVIKLAEKTAALTDE